MQNGFVAINNIVLKIHTSRESANLRVCKLVSLRGTSPVLVPATQTRRPFSARIQCTVLVSPDDPIAPCRRRSATWSVERPAACFCRHRAVRRQPCPRCDLPR